MKKMQIILKSLSIICIPLALLWTVLLFLGNKLSSNTNVVYQLPEQTEFMLKLDLNNLDEHLFDEILVGGEADEIINLLKENYRSSKFEKEFGINWFQPVTYFQTDFAGGRLQGLIVSVSDRDSWNKNINTFLGNTSIARSVGHDGIVVQSQNLSKSDLDRFVRLCKSDKKERIEHSSALVQIKQKTNQFESDFICDVYGSSVVLNGVSRLNGRMDYSVLNYMLKPAAFHFTTDFVPDSITFDLSQFFPISEVENLNLIGLSFNYRGLTIDNSSGELILLPNADFVLKFNRDVSLSDVKQMFKQEELIDSQIKLGSKVFYYKHVSKDVLYIGESDFENAGVLMNNKRIGLRMSGDPSQLTNLEGSSFVKAAISMSNNISSVFQLLRSMKGVDMQTQFVDDSKMNIEMRLNFKDDKHPILPVLKSLLINFL